MRNEHDLTSPGPFEFLDPADAEGSQPVPISGCATAIVAEPPQEPSVPVEEAVCVRELDCAHYDECLNLAAALNWTSFTCEGCCGEVNQTLLWRAHQSARKDSVARRLCGLRPLKMLKGSGVT